MTINTKTYKKSFPVQSGTSLCYLQNENMSIKNLIITLTKEVKKWITTFTHCTRKLKPIERMNTEEPAVGHSKCYKM